MKFVGLGLLALAAALLVAAGYAGNSRIAEPSWPQARTRFSEAQGCVEPTDIMRKDHMTFLFDQRDKTVHQGIRTKRHSLVGCVNCHASMDQNGKPIPINAAGQFCQSCHAYTGVKMDCFQCHATTPAMTTSFGLPEHARLKTAKGLYPSRRAAPVTISVVLGPRTLNALLADAPGMCYE